MGFSPFIYIMVKKVRINTIIYCNNDKIVRTKDGEDGIMKNKNV